MFEAQQVEGVCSVCNTQWKTTCSSGHPRERIATFARVHLHRDPLTPTRIEKAR
jgi:hypothetical protein